MASTYKTPGVYVEEISKLPASVAQVETAIPAFIGYTEIAEENGAAITEPKKISSMLEYETYFGGPYPETDITVNVTDSGTIVTSKTSNMPSFAMHYAMQMFFANGGGDCFIASVGKYVTSGAKTAISKTDLLSGLSQIAKEDEPTLILFPDAFSLDDQFYYDVHNAALSQCKKLGDRFVIVDVRASGTSDVSVSTLRNKLSNDLMYGAAYHPYLETSLTYHYINDDVAVTGTTATKKVEYKLTGTETDLDAADKNKLQAYVDAGNVFWDKLFDSESNFRSVLTEVGISGKKADNIVKLATIKSDSSTINLGDVKASNNQLYNQISKEITAFPVVLPPSSAMAGIYAKVDNDRGVWKAPANIGLTNVIKPTIKITNDDQESLNVDVNGGKSINAIRAFIGKGVLVWGSRTLDGNSNEWRYVPVRRFFNMVEESVKKSSAWVVFEPNDANTWVKVKAMIENYLVGLWKAGALAGAVPEDAFYVNVGLGTTMTSQDILEGRMIIEIGMAAVRPAEFIILRFSHKIQES